MAGRCLGELVRKMGDRILAQIIPILRDGMASPHATTRQVSARAGRPGRPAWLYACVCRPGQTPPLPATNRAFSCSPRGPAHAPTSTSPPTHLPSHPACLPAHCPLPPARRACATVCGR